MKKKTTELPTWIHNVGGLHGPVKHPERLREILLHVTLWESHPPIWRDITMSSDMTLDDLHWAIQGSFEWQDSHMHQFEVHTREYYNSLENELNAPEFKVKDSREVTIGALLDRKVKRFLYTYDFGDSWEHTIEVKKVHHIEKPLRYPECLAGSRHGPPEDCGGIPGYEDFIKIMADKRNPEHEEMAEWYGKGKRFNPEVFGLQRANKRIHDLIGPYTWAPIDRESRLET